MLRKEIMSVLLEGGSEYIGNPIERRKYKNFDSLPKTGSIYFIFGPKLEIDARNIF